MHETSETTGSVHSEVEHQPVRRTGRDEVLSLDFPHILVAKAEVRKYMLDKSREEAICRVLEGINTQSRENYTLYEPHDFKGVSLPYTHISINDLVAKNSTQEEKTQLDSAPIGRHIWYVEIGGFVLPPGGYPMVHG